jgi:hypothetical protein
MERQFAVRHEELMAEAEVKKVSPCLSLQEVRYIVGRPLHEELQTNTLLHLCDRATRLCLGSARNRSVNGHVAKHTRHRTRRFC